MAEFKIGGLVRSLAGHDKDSYFIIIRQDAEYVYLADGKIRRLENAKRKKKKHVQLTHDIDEELHRKLMSGDPVINEEIKHFIKCWKERNKGGRANV